MSTKIKAIDKTIEDALKDYLKIKIEKIVSEVSEKASKELKAKLMEAAKDSHFKVRQISGRDIEMSFNITLEANNPKEI